MAEMAPAYVSVEETGVYSVVLGAAPKVTKPFVEMYRLVYVMLLNLKAGMVIAPDTTSSMDVLALFSHTVPPVIAVYVPADCV